MNPIDMSQIKDKSSKYNNLSELKEDISWLAHNCDILHASKVKVMKASKDLMKCFVEEIERMKICSECYSIAHANSERPAVMPCKKKHPVIWAQSEGFNFWPAKAMEYDENTRLVHVQYFGDSTLDEVKLENCYQFSQQAPEKFTTDISDELYKDALKVF